MTNQESLRRTVRLVFMLTLTAAGIVQVVVLASSASPVELAWSADSHPEYLSSWGSAHQGHSTRLLEKVAYSEFNHRSAGLLVLCLGAIALTMEARLIREPANSRWCWLWPAGWVLLGVYLFVRNDPDNWPWGPIGFVETFTDPESLQHKVFVVILVLIGVIEALRLRRWLWNPRWALVFPVLTLTAGLLLGLHSFLHRLNELILREHLTLAGLTIMVGLAKLARDRQAAPERFKSLLWPVLILLVGMQLVFYRE